MNCNATKLTRLERGNTLPDLWDLCMLGLIFGRTFESLFAYILSDCRSNLALTLESLPDDPSGYRASQNRQRTLNRLAADLADHVHREHGRP